MSLLSTYLLYGRYRSRSRPIPHAMTSSRDIIAQIMVSYPGISSWNEARYSTLAVESASLSPATDATSSIKRAPEALLSLSVTAWPLNMLPS
nr:unnamed protein product [Digitaria exilis]